MASATPPPEVTGSYGNVTVGQLTDGGISLQADKPIASRTFAFRLPPGAKQGPDTWYMVRLEVDVTFSLDSGPGSVLVSSSTNGRAAAQVQFYPHRKSDGSLVTSWSSVDLINGGRSGRFNRNGGRVKYVNYLQFSGVQAGLNTLSFEAERFGKADVASIKIGSISGVYATPAGPAELELGGGFTQSNLDVGELGELELRISNASSRAEKDVEVTVQDESGHLFTRTPVTRQIKEVDGSVVQRFAIGRTQPGDLRVLVTAAGNGESEASRIFSAEVADEDDGLALLFWLGMGVLIAAAVAQLGRYFKAKR